MKFTYTLIIASAISTSAFATNMTNHKNLNAPQISGSTSNKVENILQDKDMRRLHRQMTQDGLSEVGMEARRKMIATAKGMAYHQAIEK